MANARELSALKKEFLDKTPEEWRAEYLSARASFLKDTDFFCNYSAFSVCTREPLKQRTDAIKKLWKKAKQDGALVETCRLQIKETLEFYLEYLTDCVGFVFRIESDVDHVNSSIGLHEWDYFKVHYYLMYLFNLYHQELKDPNALALLKQKNIPIEWTDRAYFTKIQTYQLAQSEVKNYIIKQEKNFKNNEDKNHRFPGKQFFDSIVLLLSASELRKQKKTTEAYQKIMQALVGNMDNPYIHIEAAELFFEEYNESKGEPDKSKLKKSLEALQTSISTFPTRKAYIVRAGILMANKGNPRQIVSDLLYALALSSPYQCSENSLITNECLVYLSTQDILRANDEKLIKYADQLERLYSEPSAKELEKKIINLLSEMLGYADQNKYWKTVVAITSLLIFHKGEDKTGNLHFARISAMINGNVCVGNAAESMILLADFKRVILGGSREKWLSKPEFEKYIQEMFAKNTYDFTRVCEEILDLLEKEKSKTSIKIFKMREFIAKQYKITKKLDPVFDLSSLGLSNDAVKESKEDPSQLDPAVKEFKELENRFLLNKNNPQLFNQYFNAAEKNFRSDNIKIIKLLSLGNLSEHSKAALIRHIRSCIPKYLVFIPELTDYVMQRDDLFSFQFIDRGIKCVEFISTCLDTYLSLNMNEAKAFAVEVGIIRECYDINFWRVFTKSRWLRSRTESEETVPASKAVPLDAANKALKKCYESLELCRAFNSVTHDVRMLIQDAESLDIYNGLIVFMRAQFNYQKGYSSVSLLDSVFHGLSFAIKIYPLAMIYQFRSRMIAELTIKPDYQTIWNKIRVKDMLCALALPFRQGYFLREEFKLGELRFLLDCAADSASLEEKEHLELNKSCYLGSDLDAEPIVSNDADLRKLLELYEKNKSDDAVYIILSLMLASHCLDDKVALTIKRIEVMIRLGIHALVEKMILTQDYENIYQAYQSNQLSQEHFYQFEANLLNQCMTSLDKNVAFGVVKHIIAKKLKRNEELTKECKEWFASLKKNSINYNDHGNSITHEFIKQSVFDSNQRRRYYDQEVKEDKKQNRKTKASRQKVNLVVLSNEERARLKAENLKHKEIKKIQRQKDESVLRASSVQVDEKSIPVNFSELRQSDKAGRESSRADKEAKRQKKLEAQKIKLASKHATRLANRHLRVEILRQERQLAEEAQEIKSIPSKQATPNRCDLVDDKFAGLPFVQLAVPESAAGDYTVKFTMPLRQAILLHNLSKWLYELGGVGYTGGFARNAMHARFDSEDDVDGVVFFEEKAFLSHPKLKALFDKDPHFEPTSLYSALYSSPKHKNKLGINLQLLIPAIIDDIELLKDEIALNADLRFNTFRVDFFKIVDEHVLSLLSELALLEVALFENKLRIDEILRQFNSEAPVQVSLKMKDVTRYAYHDESRQVSCSVIPASISIKEDLTRLFRAIYFNVSKGYSLRFFEKFINQFSLLIKDHRPNAKWIAKSLRSKNSDKVFNAWIQLGILSSLFPMFSVLNQYELQIISNRLRRASDRVKQGISVSLDRILLSFIAHVVLCQNPLISPDDLVDKVQKIKILYPIFSRINENSWKFLEEIMQEWYIDHQKLDHMSVSVELAWQRNYADKKSTLYVEEILMRHKIFASIYPELNIKQAYPAGILADHEERVVIPKEKMMAGDVVCYTDNGQIIHSAILIGQRRDVWYVASNLLDKVFYHRIDQIAELGKPVCIQADKKRMDLKVFQKCMRDFERGQAIFEEGVLMRDKGTRLFSGRPPLLNELQEMKESDKPVWANAVKRG